MSILRNNRYVSDETGTFHCAICNIPYRLTDFKDVLSVKEAGISGMCQECQDYTFSYDPDTEPDNL